MGTISNIRPILKLLEHVNSHGVRVLRANRAPTEQEVRDLTDDEIERLDLTPQQESGMAYEASDLLLSRVYAAVMGKDWKLVHRLAKAGCYRN